MHLLSYLPPRAAAVKIKAQRAATSTSTTSLHTINHETLWCSASLNLWSDCNTIYVQWQVLLHWQEFASSNSAVWHQVIDPSLPPAGFPNTTQDHSQASFSQTMAHQFYESTARSPTWPTPRAPPSSHCQRVISSPDTNPQSPWTSNPPPEPRL